MLLLYPLRNPKNQLHLQIYIPLCFYFICIFWRSRLRRIIIYIPLCFYFILILATSYQPLYLFTFHYASTLSVIIIQVILMLANLHSTMLLLYLRGHRPHPGAGQFTFHYASTLSPGQPADPPVQETIYIPLCFYFIEHSLAQLPARRYYLHSTMLLLYLFLSPPKRW